LDALFDDAGRELRRKDDFGAAIVGAAPAERPEATIIEPSIRSEIDGAP
jgi:hypothetical protein